MFNFADSVVAGAKGGKAKTSRKQDAARRNGNKGGRPPSRTLVERLLGKRIEPGQRKYIAKAYDQLFEREKRALAEHFQLQYVLNEEPMHTALWRSKSRRIPKEIRYIIKRFKLAASLYLKEAPPPKTYVVETQSKSPYEIEAWERRHPSIPCPPRRVKVYVEELPYFQHFENLYARNPNLTTKEIMDTGGSRWTQERAAAAIEWIKYKHSSGKS